jgi:hypothetical protein
MNDFSAAYDRGCPRPRSSSLAPDSPGGDLTAQSEEEEEREGDKSRQGVEFHLAERRVYLLQ